MATYFQEHQKAIVFVAVFGIAILVAGVWLGNYQNYQTLTHSDRNFREIVNSNEQGEQQRAAEADRVIRFVSIYLCDIEEDIDKVKDRLNITNNDRALNNGTHIKIDGRYVLELPTACIPNPSPS